MPKALRVWLVALDQLVCVSLALPFYLAGRAPLPDPRETISSLVGRNALMGRRWALAAEWFIDGLLGPGHCRDSITSFRLL